MKNIAIDTSVGSYQVIIEKGLLQSVLGHVEAVFKGKKILIISDDHVAPLYGHHIVDCLSQRYDVLMHVMKHGEQSKHFSNVEAMYGVMIDFGMSRFDCIIALGGGVIGDFAGFIASTYMRSIPYIQIPTSLLSQVDSSVGSKVAVDLDQGKNLVGSFYNPLCVLIDPLVLDTLDPLYFSDGMAEVIKYGLIEDVTLFEMLQKYHDYSSIKPVIEEVIARCVACKQRFVVGDVYDKGKRMMLNFGHTIGHAIELHYGFQKYSHGHAVAIGMAMICKMSEQNNQSLEGTYDLVVALLQQYNLPIEDGVEVKYLIEGVLRDKKRNDSILNYILIKEIGSAFIYQAGIEYIL